MTTTVSYDFSVPSDYTYDSSKIDLSNGDARLKLYSHTVDFTNTIDSNAGFTYDNTKAEFTGGKVQKKYLRPTNATFGATYTSSVNGSWGNGTLTGTLYGSATVSSGVLNLPIGNTGYALYSATANAAFTQTGAIKFKYTPLHSSSPSVNSYIFTIAENSGLVNQIYFYHATTGRLYLVVYDSSGNAIINTFFGAWSPTAGTTYEFELNLDFTGGIGIRN